MKKSKAVIYARTSSYSEKDDNIKVSIEEQSKACQNLTEKQGYEVIGIFQDKNIFGRTYPAGCPLMKSDSVIQKYLDDHNIKQHRNSRNGLASVIKSLSQIDAVLVRDEIHNKVTLIFILLKVERIKYSYRKIPWLQNCLLEQK